MVSRPSDLSPLTPDLLSRRQCPWLPPVMRPFLAANHTCTQLWRKDEVTISAEAGHICLSSFFCLLLPLRCNVDGAIYMQHLIQPVRSTAGRVSITLMLHAEQGVQAAGAFRCCPSSSLAL